MSRLPSLSLSALATLAMTFTAANSLQAATVGHAVTAIGSDTSAGSTVAVSPGGLSDAIEYYIPLTSGGTCTYGVTCGTSVDSGYGGTDMSMFIKFSGLATDSTSELTVNFDDLDLIGVNDPSGFVEDFQIFDSSGSALTSLISSIAHPNATGNSTTQQVTLDLGDVSGDLWLEFVFSANETQVWQNTAEYLTATIDQTPIPVPEVPLPAAFPLFLTALGGLGLVRHRRRAKRAE